MFHSICHIGALASLIVGLIAIVRFKERSGAPIVYPYYSMYSAHSWMGVITIAIWSCQLLFAG